MKKKPTAFIDSESEDDTEEVASPKKEKKNNVVTNIESSDEDDDTGIFQDAESGILETPQQSPETPKNSQETPQQSSDNSDDSIVILDTPPPPPKSLETKKETLNPMNNSMSEILTQLEHNQQQQQKLIKLLSTTGGGVMLPDKGAKLKRDLQHVKDRRVVLKENLEQKMNKSKEKGNFILLIKYVTRVLFKVSKNQGLSLLVLSKFFTLMIQSCFTKAPTK